MSDENGTGSGPPAGSTPAATPASGSSPSGVKTEAVFWDKKWTQGKDGKPMEGYLGPKAEGKKEGELGSAEGSAGLGYGKLEVKSKLSVDLKKAEVDLTVVDLTAKAAVAHAEGKGEFKLGKWFMGLFGTDELPKDEHQTTKTDGSGSSAPKIARVTDLTTHGSPLVPGIGSPNVFAGNLPVWRANADTIACAVDGSTGKVLVGAPTVWVNNMMLCRVGDVVVEVPAGPNLIKTGLDSIWVGPIGTGGGGADGKKDDKKDNDLALLGTAEGDLGLAEAKGKLVGKLDKTGLSAEAKGDLMLAAAKGEVEGKFRIPLPWGHSITLGAKAEGTAGSLGIGGEASLKANSKDGFEAKLGGKAAALLGGGLTFSLGIK